MVDYLKKVRRVQDHDCTLPIDEDDDLVTNFIYSGLCVSFRRKFHRFIMVDDSNPEAKKLLKSTAKIRKEQERHLKHHFYTIHPFSMYRTFWEALMSLMYFFHFLVMPLEMFSKWPPTWMVMSKFTGDLVCISDIVVHFFSGYYDKNSGKIVLDLRKIAKTYLLGYLILDVIGSLPINVVLILSKVAHTHYYLKLTYVFKLLRLPTFFLYVERLCARFGVTIHNVKAIKMGYATVILVLWATSLKFLAVTFVEDIFLPAQNSYSSHGSFMESLLFTVLHTYRVLFLVGFEYHTAPSAFNQFLDIIYLFLGAIVNMMIFAIITHVYLRNKCNSNKYEQIVQQITNYMKYKALPPALRAKIMRFIDFKCHKSVLNEEEILITLSKTLNENLLLHKCQKMMEQVEFFRDIPIEILLKLMSKLKSEIYLTGELVVRSGIVGYSMYFIYLGSVALYAPDATEVSHLDDGDCFGENALLANEPRPYTVIAIKDSEVFKLNRRDFNEVMESYLPLRDRIKSITARLSTSTNYDIPPDDDPGESRRPSLR